MKIVLKADHIAPGGGLTHFNQTCKWFARLQPSWRFIVLGREGQQELFNEYTTNFEYHYYKKPSKGKISQFLWGKFELPKLVEAHKPDLFFVPGNFSGSKVNCPTVSLVHNIAPFSKRYIAKEKISQKVKLHILRAVVINSLQKSDGIIFLSRFCQRYFAQFYDTNSNKSITAYHGRPEDQFKFVDDSKTLSIYDIAGEYILSVSHIFEYKKMKEMVDGYLIALEKNKNLPPLIIAGTPYDDQYKTQILKKVEECGYKNKVRFIGNVPEKDLSVLYRNCSAFIFSSSLETCSVILIEAMANGCPIICSNKTVMPEVSGHTALYYNPTNSEYLSQLILKVLSDSELSQQLKKKSIDMSLNYSWEKSSEKILSFFCQLLNKEYKYDDHKSLAGV